MIQMTLIDIVRGGPALQLEPEEGVTLESWGATLNCHPDHTGTEVTCCIWSPAEQKWIGPDGLYYDKLVIKEVFE